MDFSSRNIQKANNTFAIFISNFIFIALFLYLSDSIHIYLPFLFSFYHLLIQMALILRNTPSVGLIANLSIASITSIISTRERETQRMMRKERERESEERDCHAVWIDSIRWICAFDLSSNNTVAATAANFTYSHLSNKLNGTVFVYANFCFRFVLFHFHFCCLHLRLPKTVIETHTEIL